MGGKKRPTISQLEKRVMKEQTTKAGKQEDGRPKLKVTSEGALTQASMDAVYRELAKQPYVTPYLVANMFGLKLSAAKRALRELESRGMLKLVSANRRVRIYVPVKAAS